MRQVIVTPYDSIWQHLYLDEARKLKEIFKDERLDIHHIGGTAVPGLSASPVIDMMLSVPSIEQCEAVLLNDGYSLKEVMKSGRCYNKGTDDRGYHLYVYLQNDTTRMRHVAYRDYLRMFSGERERYDYLKRQLAKLYPFDRSAYREGKRIFVEVMEVKALDWYNSEHHQKDTMIS